MLSSDNNSAHIDVRAEELIAQAVQMFGPICPPWKFEGVIFADGGPHLLYYPETGGIQIALSLRAIDDDLQRDFQLAHEVCHLLYPAVDFNDPVKPKTNVLNEGISTYFSILIIASDYGEEAAISALKSLAEHSPKYFSAFRLVSALMQRDSNAITKIRKIQPLINKIRNADLRAVAVGLTDEQIETLVGCF